MSQLKLVKKVLLAISAVATLVIPLLAGLAIQETAVAQDNGQAPSSRAAARSAGDPDAEYLPIYKVRPIYPPRAAARGIEGYVIVGYTVAADGTTEDVKVVQSSTTLFEQAAIESAKKYLYKPRVVNGQPTAVPGVVTKIIFKLEPDPEAVSPSLPAPSR